MKENAHAEEELYLKSEFERLKNLFDKIWRSPYSSFYRDKYKKAGFKPTDLKNPGDWLTIPPLTKEEIAKTDPWKRIYVPKNRIITTRTTSGTTTGKPTLFLLSEDADTHEYIKPFRFKSILSLNPYNRYYSLVRSLAKKRAMVQSGDIHDMPRSAELALFMKADAFLGAASTILIFHAYLKKVMNPRRIRFIMSRMEYMTRLQWENLKKSFPNAQIASIYSSVETGFNEPVSQCRETIKYYDQYHVARKHAFFEFLDEEIVITTFLGALPLIRYRTGDAGAFVSGGCRCGFKSPRVQIHGRLNHDMVRIKGLEIRADEVELALHHVLRIKNPKFKLYLLEVPSQPPHLLLEVEDEKGVAKEKNWSAARKLTETIAQKIPVSSNLSLGDAIKEGLFRPLELKTVSSFPFELKPRKIILQEA